MNESTENVFIHMGLPKSASTYLQSEVFPKLNCSIVPRNDPELDKIFSEYFHRPSNDFSLDISSILSGLSGTILFSNERSDIYTLDGRLRSLYIQMYKKLFPNSKIILVIRRQDNFVESLYKNNVMNGAWYSPLFYIGKKKNIMRNPKGVTFPVVDLSYLDWYDHIVELYSAFGKENVLVIPFELLPESPEKFIGKIVDFMGVPYPNDLNINKNVNKSLCTGAIYLRRIINRFINSETNPFFVLVENPFRLSRNKLLKKLSKYIDFNYPLKYLFGFFCSKKIYQKSVRDEILSIYSDSNDRLQQLIGFDLERYGYIQADKKQV